MMSVVLPWPKNLALDENVREALIYLALRPGSALEALIYQGSTTGFLNKLALPQRA